MGADGADLSCPGSSVVTKLGSEAERFENPSAPETILPYHALSVQSHSHTEELQAGEEPMNPYRTRQFCHRLATGALLCFVKFIHEKAG